MLHYEKHPLSRIVSVQEIVSADYVKGSHPSSNIHIHQEAWEVCVCIEGEIIVLRDHRQYTLHAGQILFIHPGLPHDIAIHQKTSAAIVVSFTCTNSEHLRPLQDAILMADETQLSLFCNIIDELRTAFERTSSDLGQLHYIEFTPSERSPLGAEQMICCYLEQLIIFLLRSTTMSQGQVVPSGQFKEAIQAYLAEQITVYIQEHITERLTVEEIAAHFHYSRARLSTIYKSYTKFGINEMITYTKIKRAKELLSEQKLSVTQISELLGFSSPQYFSHKFTKEVGVPPSKYVSQVLEETAI